MNQLPSVVGSETPQAEEGGISSGGAGVNALNLRDLGVTRTLVMLDGHRSAAVAVPRGKWISIQFPSSWSNALTS